MPTPLTRPPATHLTLDHRDVPLDEMPLYDELLHSTAKSDVDGRAVDVEDEYLRNILVLPDDCAAVLH